MHKFKFLPIVCREYKYFKSSCKMLKVSAFSLGIKLAPKLPELYAERAKAHFQLRNFVKVVDDASKVRITSDS